MNENTTPTAEVKVAASGSAAEEPTTDHQPQSAGEVDKSPATDHQPPTTEVDPPPATEHRAPATADAPAPNTQHLTPPTDEPCNDTSGDSELESQFDIPGYKLGIIEVPHPRREPKPRPQDDPSLLPTPRATRPDGTPYAAPKVHDTYGIPNIYTTQQFQGILAQHNADTNADEDGRPNEAPLFTTIYDQLSPDIDTPEYRERPANLKKAVHHSMQKMPALAPLRTMAEFELQAAHIARYLQAYPELRLIAGDICKLVFQEKDYFDTYEYPHARASDYIRPEPIDEDPATINLYLQRTRKKTIKSVSMMVGREANGQEVEPNRVRNMLEYATIAKCIKQSNPLDRSPGRPLQPNGKTIKRAQSQPSNWGGARPNTGPKRKKWKSDENDNSNNGNEGSPSSSV